MASQVPATVWFTGVCRLLQACPKVVSTLPAQHTQWFLVWTMYPRSITVVLSRAEPNLQGGSLASLRMPIKLGPNRLRMGTLPPKRGQSHIEKVSWNFYKSRTKNSNLLENLVTKVNTRFQAAAFPVSLLRFPKSMEQHSPLPKMKKWLLFYRGSQVFMARNQPQ